MVAVTLEGDPTSLTGPELAALMECFLDKLEATGVVSFGTRSSIVVELTPVPGTSTFILAAFFRPGSGVTIADAHAIAAAIQAGSSGSNHFVTCDDGTTQYPIAGVSAEHEVPSPTSSPTPLATCANYRWDSAGLPLVAATFSGGKGEKKMKSKFGKGEPSSSVPIHQFTDTIVGCPLIDASVYAGVGHRYARNHGCGFNGRTFNCDFWNLTRACDGSAAGTPGSEAMIAVCDALCDRVDGCDGSMLDHSYDESSGLCTLHTGIPVLAEACFFYSSADGITDQADCASSSDSALPGSDASSNGPNPKGFKLPGNGADRKGFKTFAVETSAPNRHGSAHSPGDGVCEREPPHGGKTKKTGGKTGGKKAHQKTKDEGKSMGKSMGMGKSMDKSNGSEGDANIEVASAEKKDLVVGLVAAVVLLTFGFGVALYYALPRRCGSTVVLDSADGTPEPSSPKTGDLQWELSLF